MNELALFAGAGGGILGGNLLGWRTICAVEWEPYPASVLCARQNDQILSPFPIWDDVQTFDGRSWRGIVDVVSGGFPCQDISSAGKGAGIEGEKSGMWKHMARIIGEVRPRFAFVENSPMLTSRGLGRVLGDLASLGYDAEWCVLSAGEIGASHKRDRIWICAKQRGFFSHTKHNWTRWGEQWEKGAQEENGIASKIAFPDTNSTQRKGEQFTKREQNEHAYIGDPCWWGIEPSVGRVADGVAARMDRLKAIGNGQVPLCAATAFALLASRFNEQDNV